MFTKHVHRWVEKARTYAEPLLFEHVKSSNEHATRCLLQGSTTILWECQDPECQALRKEELVGKER